MADELNQRQRNFVDNLMEGMTQKEAYIEAGYKSRGNTAETNASRLLRNDKVQQRLQEIQQERIISTKSQMAKLLNQAIETHREIQEKEEMSKEERKNLKLKLKSAKDILDRFEIGGKDTEINIENTRESLDEKEEELRDRYNELLESLDEED